MMRKKNQVFVMLSGGVDSAVATLLLRDQGYQITGVFMKNWSPNTLQSLTDCPWEQDLADAEAVAKKLGIEFRSVNFEPEYRQAVVDYFLAEYRAGRTPNPDVKCNQEIKFGAFYRWAIAQGADYVASGHYASIIERDGQLFIGRGIDHTKDQSYFLWAIDQSVLQQVLLPLGELTKKQVRAIAKKADLPVAAKKDSQGICFIGHLNVARWLRAELGVKPGPVKLRDGTIIGWHDGTHLYTIGQRHGFSITKVKALSLALNLPKAELPILYVVAKDRSQNTLIVDNQPPANRQKFGLAQVRWYLPQLAQQIERGDSVKLNCQVRYRQTPIEVKVALPPDIEDNIEVTVDPMQSVTAVTAGQFAVFYDSDLVVGGGVIVLGG